jgi:hypothetical protein
MTFAQVELETCDAAVNGEWCGSTDAMDYTAELCCYLLGLGAAAGETFNAGSILKSRELGECCLELCSSLSFGKLARAAGPTIMSVRLFEAWVTRADAFECGINIVELWSVEKRGTSTFTVRNSPRVAFFTSTVEFGSELCGPFEVIVAGCVRVGYARLHVIAL